QLDPDGARQRLERDLATLWPRGIVVRQVVAPGRDRVAAVTLTFGLQATVDGEIADQIRFARARSRLRKTATVSAFAVTEILPASSQNRASGANSSQTARPRK